MPATEALTANTERQALPLAPWSAYPSSAASKTVTFGEPLLQSSNP